MPSDCFFRGGDNYPDTEGPLGLTNWIIMLTPSINLLNNRTLRFDFLFFEKGMLPFLRDWDNILHYVR